MDETRRRAWALLNSGKTAEAIKLFEKLELMCRTYSEKIKTPTLKKKYVSQAESFGEKAKELKKSFKGSAHRIPASSGINPGSGEDSNEDYKAGAKKFISKSTLTWNDICGLESAKKTIQMSVIEALAMKDESISINPPRNILLYGPPGVGKSILAGAVSNQIRATFFNLEIRSVLNKYVGVAPKIVSSVFELAREREPSIIFADEIDAVAPSRSKDSNVNTGLLQTMLTELQGFGNTEDGRFVMFMAATNVPWELDSAILSRFDARIYVPLPDAAMRESIFRANLEKKGLKVGLRYSELANLTDGYSGRAISFISKKAVQKMIERVNPSAEKVGNSEPEVIRKYKLSTGEITAKELKEAIATTREIIDKKSLARFEQFKNEFGSE